MKSKGQKAKAPKSLKTNLEKQSIISIKERQQKITEIHLNERLEFVYFEESCKHFLNILPTNNNYSIHDILKNFDCIELEEDLYNALNDWVEKERLITSTNERKEFFRLKIIPFKEGNNKRIGLVFYEVFLSKREKALLENQAIMNKKTEALMEENKRLQMLNKGLQQLAYVTAHDLKQPLRTIDSFANLIKKKEGEALSDDTQTYLDLILQSIGNMQDLVGGLLQHGNHGNKNKKSATPIDFSLIFKNVFLNLAAVIKESKVQIKLGKMPKNLLVDRIKMSQIFQNLIANAIKFRKKNVPCVVEISAKNQSTYWEFRIQDNGIGISKQHHKTIFQFSKKLHCQEEYSGSGFGLSICKKIVEQYGGEIWVESEEGKGAAFHFILPKKLV